MSQSPSKTSTLSSPACEPAARSSSASWSATRTATGSATSAAPRGSSSSWPSRSADGSGPPPDPDQREQPDSRSASGSAYESRPFSRALTGLPSRVSGYQPLSRVVNHLICRYFESAPEKLRAKWAANARHEMATLRPLRQQYCLFCRYFIRRERRGSIPDFKHRAIEIRLQVGRAL
jgi:hypothetical protein